MQRELLFSDNLKYFRQKNGLTQKELRNLLRFARMFLKHIEKEPVYGAVQIARKEFLKNAEN